MEANEEACGDDDERRVEDVEADFVLHDVVAPTASHLSDTVVYGQYKNSFKGRALQKSVGVLPVDASDKDGNECARDGESELAELGILPDRDGGRGGIARVNMLLGAEEIIGTHDTKADEDDDLERDTGDDGVVSSVEKLLVRLASGSCNATSDSLDNQTRQIGREEDDGIPLGPQSRQLRVDSKTNMLQRQVDRDTDESRSQDDGANLQLESARVPNIMVKQDTADVASRLQNETAGETGAVGPCPLPDGEDDGGGEEGAEDDGEEDGGAEVGDVAEDGGFDGAEVGDLCAVPHGLAAGVVA